MCLLIRVGTWLKCFRFCAGVCYSEAVTSSLIPPSLHQQISGHVNGRSVNQQHLTDFGTLCLAVVSQQVQVFLEPYQSWPSLI